MKIISRNEAKALIKERPEATLIMGIHSGEDCSVVSFIKSIDESDGEYKLYKYSNGQGWFVPMMTVKSAESLTERLCDECGKRCGGIYISEPGEHIWSEYTDPCYMHTYTYILGSEKEIRDMLPSMKNGEYCFVFREPKSDEEIYREREMMYLSEDAKIHLQEHLTDDGDDIKPDKDLCDFLAERFLYSKDCNIDDNTVWDTIIREELPKIRGEALESKKCLRRTVVEFCSNCESEIEMMWDVKRDGYKAYCPVCGNRLMLCDECSHRNNGEFTDDCDWDGQTGTCRFSQGNAAQNS